MKRHYVVLLFFLDSIQLIENIFSGLFDWFEIIQTRNAILRMPFLNLIGDILVLLLDLIDKHWGESQKYILHQFSILHKFYRTLRRLIRCGFEALIVFIFLHLRHELNPVEPKHRTSCFTCSWSTHYNQISILA
jgi:hypothetical protein